MGRDWWHTSSIGHFINSTHLWSVELFFVFMVIHLWGKFFMAAWRGKRAMTWITGAVAFVGSIGDGVHRLSLAVEFRLAVDSTQAKDGLNAVGIGAFFNVLNPGQMLMWHVVLLRCLSGFSSWHTWSSCGVMGWSRRSTPYHQGPPKRRSRRGHGAEAPPTEAPPEASRELTGSSGTRASTRRPQEVRNERHRRSGPPAQGSRQHT